ncbi:MAG TPA: DUF5668 domain-containing protein [Bacteroidales bacterium]|jgi:hypothetical protein|nr:DUF5668 domain-containing protein [Bacteroidales bacterium]HPE41075.1 DUF5668 domain-containing protein [Bacteroidales bacterium]
MNTKNIFSGIFFITLGSLWILKSLEFITFSWLDFFRLWPVIFIFIGISIIPVKDWIKLVLQILMLALTIGLLFISNSDSSIHMSRKYRIEKVLDTTIVNNKIVEETISYNEEAITNATLNLEISASKVTFIKGLKLFEMADSTQSGKGEVEIEKRIINNKAELDVELYPLEDRTNIVPRFKVLLGEKPIWTINLDINATKGEIDLSQFKVEKINVSANASSVDLKLGSLLPKVMVIVESGASSIKVRVPKNMKCIVKKDNVLSSFNVKGLKKMEDGSFASSETAKTTGIIEINVAADVSSVDIMRY